MLHSFVRSGLKFLLPRRFGFILFAAIDIFGTAGITLSTAKKPFCVCVFLLLLKKWDIRVNTNIRLWYQRFSTTSPCIIQFPIAWFPCAIMRVLCNMVFSRNQNERKLGNMFTHIYFAISSRIYQIYLF